VTRLITAANAFYIKQRVAKKWGLAGVPTQISSLNGGAKRVKRDALLTAQVSGGLGKCGDSGMTGEIIGSSWFFHTDQRFLFEQLDTPNPQARLGFDCNPP
jgi:hypothetical protein